MLKPTSTLVRLHIDQGYLETARRLLDALASADPRDPGIADLERRWILAATAARRRASIEMLKKLLARVRRARSRDTETRGAAWAR